MVPRAADRCASSSAGRWPLLPHPCTPACCCRCCWCTLHHALECFLSPPYFMLFNLAELLGSADLAPGSGLSVRGTGVKSCEGEVRSVLVLLRCCKHVESSCRSLWELCRVVAERQQPAALAQFVPIAVALPLQAVVNNRKNKIIAAYELSVTLGWEGSTADGTAVTGKHPCSGRSGRRSSRRRRRRRSSSSMWLLGLASEQPEAARQPLRRSVCLC